MCVEVCPKGVAPMDRIMQLREMAGEAGIKGSVGYRHGEAFAGSVRRLGRLDEARLLPDSVGIWNVPRLLSEVPGALRLLRAGKLPWSHALPWHKPIPGIQHVRRLYQWARAEKRGSSR
jgi:heterodisulfide reductase subunit C